MELLSPAGSFEALIAAVSGGCDAVYMGCSEFANARMNAANFTKQQLSEAVDYCHLRGVKSYITVNTLLTDRELGQLFDYATFLYNSGVDAVIVQDIGVAEFLRRNIPELEIHASTQMGLCNLDGVKYAEKIGFKRAVVARELSRDNLRFICENSNIEIEAFVHGAICACVSGYCLMSSFIGRRSGNRGKCAQPCRLKYTSGKKSGYLMSLKDMMLIDHISELKDMGVASLKIEGRMKSPGYVGTVTEVYRKAIDCGFVSDADILKLKSAFDRGGYSDSYYTGKKDFFAYEKPETTYGNQEYSKEEKKTPISLSAVAEVGKPVSITASLGELSYTATGEFVCENALKRQVTKEDFEKRLNKLGDTAFICYEPDVSVDDGLMVPLGEIGSVRREAVSGLEKLLIGKRSVLRNESGLNCDGVRYNGDFGISVSVQTEKQFKACMEADRIHVPIDLVYKNPEVYLSHKGRIIVSLPKIVHDDKRRLLSDMIKSVKEMGFSVFSASNAGDIPKCKFGDYSLWVYNSETANALSEYGFDGFCISPEINIAQLKDIKSPVFCEAIVYGRLPVMVTRNCFAKSAGSCGSCSISDRTGKNFGMQCIPEFGYSEVLNAVPIFMGDKKEDFKNTCVNMLRIVFTKESPDECRHIIKCIIDGSAYDGEYTRGHYYRGV